MVSLKFTFLVLEKIGMVNLHQFKSRRRDHLHSVLVWFNNCAMAFYVLCQSYSVFTRATRYYPEFIRTLLENLISWVLLYVIFYFQTSHRELLYLAELMDGFSKADPVIVRKCHRQTNQMYIAFVVALFLGMSGNVLESIIPISPDELRILTLVYKTRNPGRRLPFNTRIPFVDESESWAYELLYVYQLYIIGFYIICLSTVINMIPLVVTHNRGQHEILSAYIHLIGQEHRDPTLGMRIFYQNIETNAYIIRPYSPLIRRQKRTRNPLDGQENTLSQASREKYEANYVRQIVRFHQKLLVFKKKSTKEIARLVVILVVINHIFIILCLYQLVASSTNLPPLRYLKFVAVFVVVMLEFFFICNSSEVIDNYNERVVSAIKQCGWEKCTSRTRRDLCFMLRRIQGPHHMSYCHGLIVLSRALFLDIVKKAYSFVNFMKTVKK